MMYRPANLGGLSLSPESIGAMPFDELVWHWKRMAKQQRVEADGTRWKEPPRVEE